MKTATKCILVKLAWIALVIHSTVIAQHNPQPPSQAYSQLSRPTSGAPSSGNYFISDGVPFLEGQSGPEAMPISGAMNLPQRCEHCGGGDCTPPLWSFNQGVRVLNRSKPRDIITSQAVSTNLTWLEPVMATRSLDYGVAPGYVLTISRYLGRDKENRDDFLEFTYWGMNQWDITHEARGDPREFGQVGFGALFSPFDLSIGGFNRANFHELEYISEIHNFEWSVRLRPRGRPDRLVLHPDNRWRRECQPGQYLSYTAGIRYMLLNESFYFRSRGVIDVYDAQGQLVSSRQTSGDYSIFAHNNLLGLNFGVDWTMRRCRTHWGVMGKVGPYANFADRSLHVVTSAAGDPFATRELDIDQYRRANAVSLIGEVSLFGSYRFKPNVIGYLSYDMMWVTGLALAPEHLNFHINPSNQVKTDGFLFFQGMSFKLETTW